ncbi:SAM-dependent methyltransferase [Halobaculum sp. MBLA0147]|uniref:SAM-dependent methyltransferase n=1 Tax=Halobaculum sp. MBLA0147 TaxID=3079934 RepID=UPI003526328C
MSTGDDHAVETLLAVRAARETGVLEAYLESAGTPAEAARIANVTETGARVAGRALADVGVLERVDGEYEPSNPALGLLTKRDPRSIGTLPHRLDVLDTLVDLPETIETGSPPELPPEWRRNRVGADEATPEAVRRARVTTAVRAAPDATDALDVCGGAGATAAELAARGLDAAFVEAPEILDEVRPLAESRDVTPLVGPLDDLDRRFGLVTLVDVVGEQSVPEAEQTLSAAVGRVAPGGTVVVLDRFAEPAATRAAVRSLARGDGERPDESTVERVVGDTDATDVRSESVPGTDYDAVIARRPE